jgi:hypothetical protein
VRGWLVVLALAAAPPLGAQNPGAPPADTLRRRADSSAAAAERADSARALGTQRTRGDSVRPVAPITPTGAFLRSLVLPGWGQARLNRNVTGGLFLLWEGVCATMVWKAQWQLAYARERGKFVASHTQEREDWIVLLVFNHLVAAAEAYVSANLYDFPAALKVRVLPGGRAGVGISVPLR